MVVLVVVFVLSLFAATSGHTQPQYTSSRHGITVPGTKWCGPGKTAEHYNDLGSEVEADKCCRAHDHCNESIKAKSTKLDLVNDGWLPIFRCHCEDEFRACLQNVNNMVANTLGRVYYKSRSRCYNEGHPIMNCIERQWDTFETRCLSYTVDKTQPKLWQFYDMPFYTIPLDDDDNSIDDDTKENTL